MSDITLKMENANPIGLNLGTTTVISGGKVHVDTTEHWNAQRDLVGRKDELYVYSDHDVIDGVPIPAIKVGDGKAYLIDLPFLTGNETRLNNHINDGTVHITEDERLFWNDKVTCYLSQDNSETVVFSKEREEQLNG